MTKTLDLRFLCLGVTSVVLFGFTLSFFLLASFTNPNQRSPINFYPHADPSPQNQNKQTSVYYSCLLFHLSLSLLPLGWIFSHILLQSFLYPLMEKQPMHSQFHEATWGEGWMPESWESREKATRRGCPPDNIDGK